MLHKFWITSKNGARSNDRTVKLWEVNTAQNIKTLDTYPDQVRSACISFSPDGLLLASASDDEVINIWETETGNFIKTLRPDRPYERMNITGVKGLTEAQKATLKALGAIEK